MDGSVARDAGGSADAPAVPDGSAPDGGSLDAGTDSGPADAGPPPAVNSMFPSLPSPAIEQLQAWTFFWDWDRSRHQVRWMTAWDTTIDDIETFADGVGEIVALCN